MESFLLKTFAIDEKVWLLTLKNILSWFQKNNIVLFSIIYSVTTFGWNYHNIYLYQHLIFLSLILK